MFVCCCSNKLARLFVLSFSFLFCWCLKSLTHKRKMKTHVDTGGRGNLLWFFFTFYFLFEKCKREEHSAGVSGTGGSLFLKKRENLSFNKTTATKYLFPFPRQTLLSRREKKKKWGKSISNRQKKKKHCTAALTTQ